MPKGIPNKRYTPEFKKLVVETMHKEKLSVREVSAQFEIGDHCAVARRERIYLMERPLRFSSSPVNLYLLQKWLDCTKSVAFLFLYGIIFTIDFDETAICPLRALE